MRRLESALALIESVGDYKVLFVGDNIIDEYHYVTPLGRAAKEHLIPMKYESREVFSGGVLAAANHVRSFCKTVDVVMGLKTIRKVRMVERTYLRKLAEVHYEEESAGGTPLQDHYDAVVLADFGYGAVKGHRKTDFLAVSAQTNSANIGFNLITKYEKADYIVIDAPEARLAAGDRESPLQDVIRKLAKGRCNKFIVTHGPYGAYGFDGERFYHQKVFTDHVVDTMGAGDAFFAVTAPMAKTGSIEDLLLIGTAAGGLKTQIVGHRESVTKAKLIEYLKAHFKKESHAVQVQGAA